MMKHKPNNQRGKKEETRPKGIKKAKERAISNKVIPLNKKSINSSKNSVNLNK